MVFASLGPSKSYFISFIPSRFPFSAAVSPWWAEPSLQLPDLQPSSSSPAASSPLATSSPLTLPGWSDIPKLVCWFTSRAWDQSVTHYFIVCTRTMMMQEASRGLWMGSASRATSEVNDSPLPWSTLPGLLVSSAQLPAQQAFQCALARAAAPNSGRHELQGRCRLDSQPTSRNRVWQQHQLRASLWWTWAPLWSSSSRLPPPFCRRADDAHPASKLRILIVAFKCLLNSERWYMAVWDCQVKAVGDVIWPLYVAADKFSVKVLLSAQDPPTVLASRACFIYPIRHS